MAGRSAASTVRSCFIRAGTCPFLLRYFCQKAASVSLEATCARSASACRASSSMISCIIFLSFCLSGVSLFGTEQKRAPSPGRQTPAKGRSPVKYSVVPPKFRAGCESCAALSACNGARRPALPGRFAKAAFPAGRSGANFRAAAAWGPLQPVEPLSVPGAQRVLSPSSRFILFALPIVAHFARFCKS